MKNNIKKGFTLLEILAVVLIIGILASLAVPAYQRAILKARTAEVNNLLSIVRTRQVQKFAKEKAYATDFNDEALTQITLGTELTNSSTPQIKTVNSNYELELVEKTTTVDGETKPVRCVIGRYKPVGEDKPNFAFAIAYAKGGLACEDSENNTATEQTYSKKICSLFGSAVQRSIDDFCIADQMGSSYCEVPDTGGDACHVYDCDAQDWVPDPYIPLGSNYIADYTKTEEGCRICKYCFGAGCSNDERVIPIIREGNSLTVSTSVEGATVPAIPNITFKCTKAAYAAAGATAQDGKYDCNSGHFFAWNANSCDWKCAYDTDPDGICPEGTSWNPRTCTCTCGVGTQCNCHITQVLNSNGNCDCKALNTTFISSKDPCVCNPRAGEDAGSRKLNSSADECICNNNTREVYYGYIGDHAINLNPTTDPDDYYCCPSDQVVGSGAYAGKVCCPKTSYTENGQTSQIVRQFNAANGTNESNVEGVCCSASAPFYNDTRKCHKCSDPENMIYRDGLGCHQCPGISIVDTTSWSAMTGAYIGCVCPEGTTGSIDYANNTETCACTKQNAVWKPNDNACGCPDNYTATDYGAVINAEGTIKSYKSWTIFIDNSNLNESCCPSGNYVLHVYKSQVNANCSGCGTANENYANCPSSCKKYKACCPTLAGEAQAYVHQIGSLPNINFYCGKCSNKSHTVISGQCQNCPAPKNATFKPELFYAECSCPVKTTENGDGQCICDDPNASNGENHDQATCTCNEGYTIEGSLDGLCRQDCSSDAPYYYKGEGETDASCHTCEQQYFYKATGESSASCHDCPTNARYEYDGECHTCPQATPFHNGNYANGTPRCEQCPTATPNYYTAPGADTAACHKCVSSRPYQFGNYCCSNNINTSLFNNGSVSINYVGSQCSICAADQVFVIESQTEVNGETHYTGHCVDKDTVSCSQVTIQDNGLPLCSSCLAGSTPQSSTNTCSCSATNGSSQCSCSLCSANGATNIYNPTWNNSTCGCAAPGRQFKSECCSDSTVKCCQCIEGTEEVNGGNSSSNNSGCCPTEKVKIKISNNQKYCCDNDLNQDTGSCCSTTLPYYNSNRKLCTKCLMTQYLSRNQCLDCPAPMVLSGKATNGDYTTCSCPEGTSTSYPGGFVGNTNCRCPANSTWDEDAGKCSCPTGTSTSYGGGAVPGTDGCKCPTNSTWQSSSGTCSCPTGSDASYTGPAIPGTNCRCREGETWNATSGSCVCASGKYVTKEHVSPAVSVCSTCSEDEIYINGGCHSCGSLGIDKTANSWNDTYKNYTKCLCSGGSVWNNSGSANQLVPNTNVVGNYACYCPTSPNTYYVDGRGCALCKANQAYNNSSGSCVNCPGDEALNWNAGTTPSTSYYTTCNCPTSSTWHWNANGVNTDSAVPGAFSSYSGSGCYCPTNQYFLNSSGTSVSYDNLDGYCRSCPDNSSYQSNSCQCISGLGYCDAGCACIFPSSSDEWVASNIHGTVKNGMYLAPMGADPALTSKVGDNHYCKFTCPNGSNPLKYYCNNTNCTQNSSQGSTIVWICPSTGSCYSGTSYHQAGGVDGCESTLRYHNFTFTCSY